MRLTLRSWKLLFAVLIFLSILMLKFDDGGVPFGPTEAESFEHRGPLKTSPVNQTHASVETQPSYSQSESKCEHHFRFPGDLRDSLLENERRKRILSQGCRAMNFTGEDGINAWEYIIDKDHHLIWCNVFKAGFTSWIHYLFRLRNIIDPEKEARLRKLTTVVELLRKTFGRPKLEELEKASAAKEFVSFFVTRHPMERLVSAYRDKLERGRESYRRNLQREVLRKVLKRSRIPKRPPTFSEFVTYILEEESLGHHHNEHWIPISRFCTPCHFPFSVISKMETFNEDVELIMWLANQEIGLLGPLNAHQGGKTNQEVTQSYVGQLSPAEFDAIQRFYHNDYVLFEYEKSRYFPNHTETRH